MKPKRIAALRKIAFRITGSGAEGPLIECLDDIERLMEGERAADKVITRLNRERAYTLAGIEAMKEGVAIRIAGLEETIRRLKREAANTEGQDNG